MEAILCADCLVSNVAAFGTPVLGLIVFVGALGVPFPGTLLVIAAGALYREGILDLGETLVWALSCVVLGDVIGYALGRWGLAWLPQHQSDWAEEATRLFQRQGVTAVYLTRWLLTPMAVPINWIAGRTKYPFSRFILFDVLGEATWLLLYGGIGYLFSNQWETVSTQANHITNIIFYTVLFGLILLVVTRRRHVLIPS